MKKVAEGLAALGRGPDTMLVHMSPREVAGLQQLAMAHGGSLTTNPHTGLPEAGFLDNMLPALAAAAAIYFTGGAAAPGVLAAEGAGAAAAGAGGLFGLGSAGTGALTGAATGALTNRQNPLQGALMGGLSGYGIGGGMGALGQMGADQAGVEASRGLAESQLAAMNPTPAAEIPLAFPGEQYIPGGPTSYTVPASNAAGWDTAALRAEQQRNMLAGSAGENYAKGLGQLTQPGGMEKFGSYLGGQYGGTAGKAAAGIGAIGALGGFEQPQLDFLAPQQQPSNYRAQTMNRRPYDPERNLFTDYGQLQPVYAAKGGAMHSVPELEDGGFVLTKKAVDGIGKGSNERGQRTASAGLGAIPIKGPGTGTSDSIRTTIEGKRPALLSNGEAYVPRDQVKRRGGAKKFYALMKQAEREAARRA